MAGYAEIRPAFLGEVVTLTATVEGSGSIAAWEFADDRTLTVTVAGQEDVGDHRLVVTRTDDDSGLVVFRGVLEVTDPAVP
jgi:predicted regulator of Ras-like GTPase activity (Roadblock/LC7/MglB family)